MEPCDFAYALRALLAGETVTRRGWNANHALRLSRRGRASVGWQLGGDDVELAPFIVIFTLISTDSAGIKTWQEARPWLASQADLLADDWSVIPDGRSAQNGYAPDLDAAQPESDAEVLLAKPSYDDLAQANIDLVEELRVLQDEHSRALRREHTLADELRGAKMRCGQLEGYIRAL